MEAQRTSAFVQNENIHVRNAKIADGSLIGGSVAPLKPLEKKKKGVRADRKALADIPRGSARPAVPLSSKSTVVKNVKNRKKPVLNAAPASSSTFKHQDLKNEVKKDNSSYDFLSEEDFKKCQQWAEEGIEYTPANDSEKLAKDAYNQRVNEEVDMVTSCLKKWADFSFNGFVDPPIASEDSNGSWDIPKLLELEPEIILPRTSRSAFFSDTEEDDAVLFHSFKDNDFVFELKDSDDDLLPY